MKEGVREFEISRPLTKNYDNDFYNSEAYCKECGLRFGVHDTKVLKPKFKAHVCKKQTPK